MHFFKPITLLLASTVATTTITATAVPPVPINSVPESSILTARDPAAEAEAAEQLVAPRRTKNEATPILKALQSEKRADLALSERQVPYDWVRARDQCNDYHLRVWGLQDGGFDALHLFEDTISWAAGPKYDGLIGNLRNAVYSYKYWLEQADAACRETFP